MTQDASTNGLEITPLHALHCGLGAKMVPFAGYDMPLHYRAGLLKEHLHTRCEAGLFDVSHMGQVRITSASGDFAAVAQALETLIPIDVVGLPVGRQRYGFLLDDNGGILDDLMVSNLGDHFVIVANAANKHADVAHMRARLPEAIGIELAPDALIALQGPRAEAVLAKLVPNVCDMAFMDVRPADIFGAACVIARSGYTGEDGFEISLLADRALAVAETFLADPRVQAVGLGARDSLRLEAGLCLHGADIDTSISPIEASLDWAFPPVRRRGGRRAGGFPGAGRILAELEDGVARRRVGLRAEGRLPVRAGAPLFDKENAAEPVGRITSGCFGPSLQTPIAMGYLPVTAAMIDTRVYSEVRGQRVPLVVSPLPFVPARFKRGSAPRTT